MRMVIEGTPQELQNVFGGRLNMPRPTQVPVQREREQVQQQPQQQRQRRVWTGVVINTGNNKHKIWTARQDAELKRLVAQGVSIRKIAHELGRTKKAIYVRQTLLRKGKTKMTMAAHGFKKQRPWTADDTQFMIANMNRLSRDKLAMQMKRHPVFVTTKMRQFGFKKVKGAYVAPPGLAALA